MTKKLKKLKVKQRNHLVAIVMRKAVQKHKNRKREEKGYSPFDKEAKNQHQENQYE
jgi:hypothetical protein